MSDVARYLPLSQRSPTDESGVTNDWSKYVDEAVLRVAAVLLAADPALLEAPAQQRGYRVRDTVGHLLFVLESRRRSRMLMVAKTMIGGRMLRAEAVRQLSVREGAGSREDLSIRLHGCIRGNPNVGEHTAAARGSRRRTIGELSAAVVDGYDVARSLGVPLALSSTASGAVALARSTTAPLPLRAGIRDRTLVATDATWRIGSGTELAAGASQLVLFLWGRAPLPEPAQPGSPSAHPHAEHHGEDR